MGTSGLDDGIVPMALSDIFERRRQLLEGGAKVDITMSCMEVYNDTLQDMLCLSTQNKDEIHLYENADGETKISAGLRRVPITTITEAQEQLRKAAAFRTTGSHAMNSQSSRSHAVYIVTVKQHTCGGLWTKSKLCLVDLAGSESVQHTGFTGFSHT